MWSTIITLLPELIALVKEIITLVQDAQSWADKKQKIGQFTDAVKVARETKDTSALESIFSGISAVKSDAASK